MNLIMFFYSKKIFFYFNKELGLDLFPIIFPIINYIKNLMKVYKFKKIKKKYLILYNI